MTPDPTREFIARLRAEADGADFGNLARMAMPTAEPPGVLARLRTRVAVAAATSVLSVGGLAGVAVAADGAAPGELLYGIDRALEAVGIGNGGAPERLAEAQKLAARGESQWSLEHAADALSDDPGVHQALIRAAEQVGPNSPVGEQVATLLRYLAQNSGDVDGAEVARLALEIKNQAGRPDGTRVGPPDGTPVGPPDGTPVGPPDGTRVGPPDGTPVGPEDGPGGPDESPGGPAEGSPGNRQGGPTTTVAP